MTASTPPVVLVHGWGGSFASTWQRSGFTALLEDAGLDVIGVDLLGHGTAPKPHDPEAYADLDARILDALPDEPVDADRVLTRRDDPAARSPSTIPSGSIASCSPASARTSSTATSRHGAPSSPGSRPSPPAATPRRWTTPCGCSPSTPAQPGNDIAALTAVMKRSASAAITAEDCARVTCPVLVVVGDKDFVYPGDELAAAFADGRCETLRNVDHFATPESFGFFDAALEFLDAIY